MGSEREFEAGAALAIALTIIPMSWPVYWALALILAALVVRIVWLSLGPAWARWGASALAVAFLAALIVPEMVTRIAGGH